MNSGSGGVHWTQRQTTPKAAADINTVLHNAWQCCRASLGCCSYSHGHHHHHQEAVAQHLSHRQTTVQHTDAYGLSNGTVANKGNSANKRNISVVQQGNRSRLPKAEPAIDHLQPGWHSKPSSLCRQLHRAQCRLVTVVECCTRAGMSVQ